MLHSQKLSINDSPVFINLLPVKQDFFFMDEDEKVVFIDFNKVDENILKIQVLNQEEKLLLEEPLNHFNTDYIHELDYSEFKSGDYHLHLITEKQTLKQTFKVRP